MQEINIKEIIKTGFILFIITAVAALILACANKVTAPIISENQLKRTYDAMAVVMPGASAFENIEVGEEQPNISEVYEAKDSGQKKIGSCIVAAANGYGGEIKVLVGIDIENKVTGVQIMSHSETPGLGANASKPDFIDQFNGKTFGVEAVKSNVGDNEINAMSGATITSKAVTSAVNAALSFAAANK